MLTKEIYNIIERSLFEWKEEIIANYTSSGERTTGKTGEEFEVNMTANGGKLLGANYVYVLEQGRGETKKNGSGAVRRNIKEWIVAKGVFDYLGEKELDSLAWAISKTIHKIGTKLFREGGRKDIYSNVITESAINELVNKIAAVITVDVSSEIIKQLKRL